MNKSMEERLVQKKAELSDPADSETTKEEGSSI